MKQINKPSICNCCNGLINFSICPMKKLVSNLKCNNSLISIFNGRIGDYVSTNCHCY